MIRRFLLLISFFLFRLTCAWAQPESKSALATVDIPIESWVGKRFIFLEKPDILRKFGYPLFLTKDYYSTKSRFDTTLEVEKTRTLRYNRFVGKTITAVAVEQDSDRIVVTFVEDGTNLTLYTRAYKGCIPDLALFDELANAKTKWLGKTIYSKKQYLTNYDSQSGSIGSLKIKTGSPLKVIDVRWGIGPGGPIALLVQTLDGEKSYLFTRLSWTNWYLDHWQDSRPWQLDFSE